MAAKPQDIVSVRRVPISAAVSVQPGCQLLAGSSNGHMLATSDGQHVQVRHMTDLQVSSLQHKGASASESGDITIASMPEPADVFLLSVHSFSASCTGTSALPPAQPGTASTTVTLLAYVSTAATQCVQLSLTPQLSHHRCGTFVSEQGKRWRALAWAPRTDGVLAVANQDEVSVCQCSLPVSSMSAASAATGESPRSSSHQSTGKLATFHPAAGHKPTAMVQVAWSGADGSTLVVSWASGVEVIRCCGSAGAQWSAKNTVRSQVLLGLPGPIRSLCSGPSGSICATVDAQLFVQGGQPSTTSSSTHDSAAALASQLTADPAPHTYIHTYGVEAAAAADATASGGGLLDLSGRLGVPDSHVDSADSPVSFLLGGGVRRDSEVPSRLLMDTAAEVAATSHINGKGEAQPGMLCIFWPRPQAAGQVARHDPPLPSQAKPIDQHTSRNSALSSTAPLLLPQPDMLYCCACVVAVGSSTGPALLQLFAVNDQGQLQPQRILGLATPDRHSPSLRLLGLQLTAPSTAVSKNAPTSPAGASMFTAPPPAGKTVQLVTLLGEVEAPAATGLSLFGGGSKSRQRMQLAALSLCSFDVAGDELAVAACAESVAAAIAAAIADTDAADASQETVSDAPTSAAEAAVASETSLASLPSRLLSLPVPAASISSTADAFEGLDPARVWTMARHSSYRSHPGVQSVNGMTEINNSAILETLTSMRAHVDARFDALEVLLQIQGKQVRELALLVSRMAARNTN